MRIATGTRWIPFGHIGMGVTATGIGPPDLSGTFEFNLQGGGGVHWFFKDNVTLTLEARYVHWSCAGIHKPNLGLNGIQGMLGVRFFGKRTSRIKITITITIKIKRSV